MFTWNSVLSGNDHRADLMFNWYGEKGSISLNGNYFSIKKRGIFSGTWIMDNHAGVILTAKKLSAFSRTFIIKSNTGSYQLKADSMFGRAMTLQGLGKSLRITPDSIFTRCATITGQLQDIEATSFATWLTFLIWRRNANKSH